MLIILLFDSYKCLIYSTSLKPLIYGTILLIYMYTCYIYNACYSWLIVDKMIYYCKYNNCVVQNIDQKIHFCPKTFKDISDILWQWVLLVDYTVVQRQCFQHFINFSCPLRDSCIDKWR